MNMTAVARIFLAIGGLSMLLAVQLSAYGFHGLPDTVTPAQRQSWDWALQMQAYHSLGLILLGVLAQLWPGARLMHWAGWIMVLGVFLFSGSIYAEVLGAPATLGVVTPFGGGVLMLAWLLVAIAAFRPAGPTTKV
jgi:uncharacterized membrane protein YgdD (TMEM256/DUF423 family)